MENAAKLLQADRISSTSDQNNNKKNGKTIKLLINVCIKLLQMNRIAIGDILSIADKIK